MSKDDQINKYLRMREIADSLETNLQEVTPVLSDSDSEQIDAAVSAMNKLSHYATINLFGLGHEEN